MQHNLTKPPTGIEYAKCQERSLGHRTICEMLDNADLVFMGEEERWKATAMGIARTTKKKLAATFDSPMG